MTVATWWGDEVNLLLSVNAGGKTYGALGDYGEKLALEEIGFDACNTYARFVGSGIEVALTFLSPLPLDDLEILALPVCELGYEIKTDFPAESIDVYFGADNTICGPEKGLKVRGAFDRTKSGGIAFMGRNEQRLLSPAGDVVGPEWGYYAVSGEECAYLDRKDYDAFVAGKRDLCRSRDVTEAVIVAHNAHEGGKAEGSFLLAFDDVAAVSYFGEILKGWFYAGGRTLYDAVDFYRHDSERMHAAADHVDCELREVSAEFGEDMLAVLRAAYRQSIGAHKLVKSGRGDTLFLSKECGSDGCIATTDVAYPAIPLYLMFAPQLVRGMITPVFEFASRAAWQYDFAPHDCGVYPHCSGQWYGAKNARHDCRKGAEDRGVLLPVWQMSGEGLYEHSRQMPVEESGNMLIMTALADKYAPDDDYLVRYFGLTEKWANYLVNAGLRPENQLCTDDFAGHLEGNINLAIKSIVGIESFAYICDRLGKRAEAERYDTVARERAARVAAMANGGALPLTFDGGEGEFALKYNLLADKLLDFGLFPPALIRAEAKLYKTKFNRFGLPLDYRSMQGKSDWMAWTAAAADDDALTREIFSRLVAFLGESPEKMAFSDWFMTDSGVLPGSKFRNRSVQGGLFAPCLVRMAAKKREKAGAPARREK